MELVTMGKVVVPAKIESLRDLFASEQGAIPTEQVRKIEVPEALVETGATLLSLPKRYIEQLGLKRYKTRTARTSAGILEFGILETVRLTVQGRECTVEVAEIPDDGPVLIGQIPLELMDWVVDPVGQRLIGNPEHGGEQMIEMF